MFRTDRCARAIRALAIAALLMIAVDACALQLPPAPEGWASRLYHQLETVKLDPARVYRIRDAAIEREDLHLKLTDGTIAFTTAVDGHITGAIFDGHGEVLLMPPDRVERWSLNVFTGSAILEERFTSAYFRFNDDTFNDLQPSFRPAEDADAFLAQWGPVAEALAGNWDLRLLETIVNGTKTAASGATEYVRDLNDRVLYARVTGVRSGLFDISYDSKAPEQIAVARLAQAQGNWYYDIWTSFPSRSRRMAATSERGNRTSNATIATQTGAEAFPPDPIRVSQYKLRVKVVLPRAIDVDATLDVQANAPGGRLLRFELSRYLKVREVTANGTPIEFVQNEALQGTELARRGNDIVSIVLPKAMEAGERLQLHMLYGGEVLAEAGGGLMYVGAHGDWYPNRGLAMSNFDLEFHYPTGWTLVATGKRVADSQTAKPGVSGVARQQAARWVSERPMPFAGFNLGQYEKASAKAGDVVVDAYASHGVESTMKQQQTVLVIPSTHPRGGGVEDLILSTPPTPANNAERVAEEGARTVEFYARRMGPYPYSSLHLTQMPGGDSQSWPGLIYLSSYVFLNSEERSNAHVSPMGNLMFQHLMEEHETAHQWWGDLLIWKSYREQWIVEALSNYCALLKLEGENEGNFHQIMDQYRQDLLAKNAAGNEVTEAGPVTLGVRLNSSRFVDGYNTISYGRGTWLFHMLRTMFQTPGPEPGAATVSVKAGSPDEPFFRVLRKLRERYEGKEITTRDVQKAFEEELPAQLQYEGRKSLDWFFDGWVNGTSVPKFVLSEVKLSSKTGKTVATGKVLLKDATEGLVTSMPVYASGAGNPILLGRIFVEGAETPFRFTVPPGTKKILLDPYQTVLSRP
jgi:hypothetical protein